MIDPKAFAAWVRQKPQDETYNFLSLNNCAIIQFLRETGVYVPGSYPVVAMENPEISDACLPPLKAGRVVTSSFRELSDRLAAIETTI